MKKSNGKKTSVINNFLYKVDIFWINIAVLFAVFIICAGNLLKTGNLGLMTLCLVILLLLLAMDVILVIMRKKRAKRRAEKLGLIDENGLVCTGVLGGFQLPAFIVSESCKLLWNNSEFGVVCEENSMKAGNVAGGLFKRHIEGNVTEERPEYDCIIKLGRRFYRLYASYVSMNDANAGDAATIFGYLVDVSGVERLKALYKSKKIVVGEIIIDNYDEIFQQNGEAVASQIQVEVNNIFEDWLKDKNAVVRRLIRERYILICETSTLNQIKAERFDVLERVKKISVGNTIPVTLSIGVSTNEKHITEQAYEALTAGDINSDEYVKAFGDTLQKHLAASEDLINLCLNRGGDQAVVQNSENAGDCQFFGGSEIDQPRKDMVQVRVTSDLLKQAVLAADNVMIMGHRAADLDALGSALAMYRVATKLKKPAYIILEGPNSQIDEAYVTIMGCGKYEGVFITKSEALNVISDNTLVIVVDTFSERQCEAPEVIEAAEKIGVVDHHRRGVDFIKNTVFNYTETLASSTSELIVEMLRYIFPGEDVLEVIEAEMLYGGIIVDTKNLFFKTGKRTFEVAAYLREVGVVPINVRRYVQPSYNDYLRITEIVGGMDVIQMDYKGAKRGIAFAECELSADEANKLASIAADKMLEFTGVECSFVLIAIGPDVSIKARSPGEINVQTVMENPRISGGGHLTAAAGIIRNTNVKEVKSLILKILKENG